MAKKRKIGRPRRSTIGRERVTLNSSPDIMDAVRQDADARWQSVSQWYREAAVRLLRQRGALPKK